VALDLLPHFARVTAVEPDLDMAALIPAQPGLAVIKARAEEADIPPGSVDAVTIGTAFHWMDAAEVCRRTSQWLRPGGALAAFNYDQFTTPGAPAAQAFVEAESALWVGHKHERLAAFEAYVDRIRQTGAFKEVEPIRLEVDWPAEPAAYVGFMTTTSFGRAYAQSTGDEAGYWASFANRLQTVSDGPLVIRYVINGAIARQL
jgi:hypothetical protein